MAEQVQQDVDKGMLSVAGQSAEFRTRAGAPWNQKCTMWDAVRMLLEKTSVIAFRRLWMALTGTAYIR